ncbi:hypothetical protein V8C86DRAFT_588752 [Haematococcus lacustris]
MSLFCVFQESLRSVRGGRHDALNSGLAGAAAASISVKVLQGSKYHRLAAIVWGPLCAASHALNELLQPRKELEDLLISANLLHPSVAGRRPASPRPHPITLDELQRLLDEQQQQQQGGWGLGLGKPTDPLVVAASLVKRREMAALAHGPDPALRPSPSSPDPLSSTSLDHFPATGRGGYPAASTSRQWPLPGPAGSATEQQAGHGLHSARVSSAGGSSSSSEAGHMPEEEEGPAPAAAAAAAEGYHAEGPGKEGRRTWWGWLRGRSKPPGAHSRHTAEEERQRAAAATAGGPVAGGPGGGASRGEEGVGDEGDEEEFQEWLAEQGLDEEGLVKVQ